MKNVKVELIVSKLEKAFLALESVAFKPIQDDRVNVDATTQRFKVTIELFWKLLKAILESKGVEAQYPKDVLSEAYKGHLINDEFAWLSILKDRNLTSHTYDEKLADEIYVRIQSYVALFRSTLDKLKILTTSV